jgi:uncharacterized protein YggE
MRLAICALLTAVVAAQAAHAQATPSDTSSAPQRQAPGTTILHLVETATIKVTPTLLVADLEASAESPAAVTAQRRVNDAMAQASRLAGKVTGVTAVFQDYTTNFSDRAGSNPAHWSVSQTIELRGTNAEDLLGLVGSLQGQGLTISYLGWQVPPNDLDAAGRRARLQALNSLRQEVGQAAGTMGMSIAGYQDIDLTGGTTPPPLFPRPRPMMMAAAMASPLATPDVQSVTATVAADVILKGTAATP